MELTKEYFDQQITSLKGEVTSLRGNFDQALLAQETRINKHIDDKIDELARDTAEGFLDCASKQDIADLKGDLQKTEYRLKGEITKTQETVTDLKNTITTKSEKDEKTFKDIDVRLKKLEPSIA